MTITLRSLKSSGAPATGRQVLEESEALLSSANPSASAAQPSPKISTGPVQHASMTNRFGSNGGEVCPHDFQKCRDFLELQAESRPIGFVKVKARVTIGKINIRQRLTDGKDGGGKWRVELLHRLR
jgi:hypothetical protein